MTYKHSALIPVLENKSECLLPEVVDYLDGDESEVLITLGYLALHCVGRKSHLRVYGL